MRILYLVRQPDDCSFWIFDTRPVRVGNRWCADDGFGVPIDRFVVTLLTSRVPWIDDDEPICINVRTLCGDVLRCNAEGALVETPQFNVIESDLLSSFQSGDELF